VPQILLNERGVALLLVVVQRVFKAGEPD
jgi:hypothetical protein